MPQVLDVLSCRRASALNAVAAAIGVCCIASGFAEADITIVDVYQKTNYWYRTYTPPSGLESGNNASDAFGWFSHSTMLNDGFGTGGARTSFETRYASVLDTDPQPSGSIRIERELTLGGVTGDDNYAMLVESYFLARLNVTRPTTFNIDASLSSFNAPGSDSGTAASIVLTQGEATPFQWYGSDWLNHPDTISASISLEPGLYTFYVYSGSLIFQSATSQPTQDALTDFNLTFAFVPAPATCFPLMAASAGLMLRRRR